MVVEIAAAVTALAAAAGAYAYRKRGGSEPDHDVAAPGDECEVEDSADPIEHTVTVEPDVPDVVTEKNGLTDIKGIGATRAEAIGKAGFSDPEDVYFATDEELTDIEGIGEYTVEQIRDDIGREEEYISPNSTEMTSDGSASGDSLTASGVA